MTFATVLLRDVTLRDGLQLTGGMLSVERKVAVIRNLLTLGVPAVEVGSLARADLVPPMANTLEVLVALTPEELAQCWVWVATPKHAKKAIEAGALNLQYCVSVTDSHNLANVGRLADSSMDGLAQTIEEARGESVEVQLCLATSFTCPFEGRVSPDRVLELAKDPRAIGVSDIVLCDTLGQATPSDVSSLVRRVFDEVPGVGLVYHGHDTWGLGVANSLAAISQGVRMVDGALGGLGGCPFAPGASGNTATEDLLFAMQPEWMSPTDFHQIVELGESVLAELQEGNRSKAAQGAQSSTSQFSWAIPRTSGL